MQKFGSDQMVNEVVESLHGYGHMGMKYEQNAEVSFTELSVKFGRQ